MLAAAISASAIGCGNTSGQNTVEGESTQQAAVSDDIVNVGVTNTLGTLNPLLMDGGEVNKYATALMFLPLVELNSDLNLKDRLRIP